VTAHDLVIIASFSAGLLTYQAIKAAVRAWTRRSR
jgi:hypothetical protein